MNSLDDRWEWIECSAFGSDHPHFVRGLCRHLDSERVDVYALGESWAYTRNVDWGAPPVASLCTTCDTQLPPRGRTES